MNGLNFFIFFVLVQVISIICSQHSIWVSANNPGASNCWVKGQYINYCSDKFAPIDQFPTECLSYFWSSFLVENDFSISHLYGKGSAVVLNDLLQTKKDIYVTYQYLDVNNFFQTIDNCQPNNTSIYNEMENLKSFLGDYQNIAGLTVTPNININTSLPERFSQNFKSYLDTLKYTLPSEMKIGVALKAEYFQLVTNTENPVEGIQFQEIDSLVDYYVVNTQRLNSECTPGFISGGLSPVDGGAKYTMEKLQYHVNQVGISNSKLLYKIFTSPIHTEKDNICSTNYRQMCIHPEMAKEWCADNLETFYDKGKFVKQNANGFIACFVDNDDALCDCKCGHPFPSFYAILNGYNGSPPPASCPMFDRI